jgi:hypothetical protein
MQLKGRCDPQKVAQLSDTDFEALYRGVAMLQRNEPLPPCLEALCFRLMRQIGARVMSHNCMRIAAVQLSYTRRLIDNLRAYTD